MELSAVQHDRAVAVLLGMACGDALGWGGVGGAFEWTSLTSAAVPVAAAAAAGRDLRRASVLEGLLEEWSRAALPPAGDGCLTRAMPLHLAFLADPVALAHGARRLCALTDPDPDTADACVLGGLAIRVAVLEGRLELRSGLEQLPAVRRDAWSRRIDEAERGSVPAGGPVGSATAGSTAAAALLRAWSAVVHDGGQNPEQYATVIEALAVDRRGDAATRSAIAALAGALLAARWGLGAIPVRWRRAVSGPPGLRGIDLVRLGLLSAQPGQPVALGHSEMPGADPGADPGDDDDSSRMDVLR